MALITCPECGREISDKAVSCPGCGYPVQDNPVDERSDLDRLVDEIYEIYPKEKVKAIKKLREATGMNLKPAKDIMDKKFQGLNATATINKSVSEQEKINKNKEELRENLNNLGKSLSIFTNLSKNPKTPHCPKCKSTSITYDTKKLSVTRGVVGYGLAGPAGAVMGGLSSKKGYAVCLNCGKRWKI